MTLLKTTDSRSNLIIFSKDRAMQLDALLRSLNAYANDFFDRVIVLYCSSKKTHNASYKLLIREHKDVEFIKESWFGKFRQLLINKCIDSNYNFTCFMVDDNLLFENISKKKERIFENFSSDTVCFSLRLGLNCGYSHPANKFFELKEQIVIDSEIIKWKWSSQNEGDFSYPLAVDGHIYRTENILPFIKSIPFINPNSLEAGIQPFLETTPPYMMSFIKSHLVGIPINLVNTTTLNFFGKVFPYHQDNLCKKFIEGYRIDFTKMNFSNISGAHQELKLEFLKK